MASQLGGFVYSNTQSSTQVSLDQVSFNQSYAGDGGGLFYLKGISNVVTVSGSSVNSSWAKNNGGFLYMAGTTSNSITIQNSASF